MFAVLISHQIKSSFPYKTALRLSTLCFTLIVAGNSTYAISVEPNESSASRLALSGLLGVWDVRPSRKRQDGDGERRSATGQGGNRAPVQMPEIEGLDVGDRLVYRMMTLAGRAAFASMNPKDLPTNNCRSSGLPTLAKVPNVQEWSLIDDVLSIHYGEFDTVREIHLDASLADVTPSQLGYSTGEFVNGVLTVTTSKLTASPGTLARNAPGSEKRTITEVYRLASHGRRITGTITIEDPLYLTKEIATSLTLVRAPEGTQLVSFPCDIEASQRYLN